MNAPPSLKHTQVNPFMGMFFRSGDFLQSLLHLQPTAAMGSALLSVQLITVTTSIQQKLAPKSGCPTFQGHKSIWRGGKRACALIKNACQPISMHNKGGGAHP